MIKIEFVGNTAWTKISVTVYHMKSTGWVHISDEDSKDLHYMYQEQKK